MPQTGSMLGFIILVALVVIGVILYAYLTVMNQAKNEAAKGIEEAGSLSRYRLAEDVPVFIKEAGADHPVEVLLPLDELRSAKAQLIQTGGESSARMDTNLIAECTRCGRRLASREIDLVEESVCSTPNCKSEEYLLRWLPGNGFVQPAPPAGE